jgi:hypothetical protein
VTADNADINDAKLVQDTVESLVSTQVVDSLDTTANTQSKYRFTYEQDYPCAYSGTIHMTTNTDNMAGSYGSSSSELSYSNCYLSQGYSVDGSIKHDLSISTSGQQSLTHTYLSDFTINADGEVMQILQDSKIDFTLANGYDTVGVLDGDFQSTAIYNFTMKHNNNTTITKDLTITSKYDNFSTGKLYTCFNKGAIYSSLAPNSNPFVIDESYDPTCDKQFVYDVKSQTMQSGSIQFYIGSKKFQTYISFGEFETCEVGKDCP